MYFIQAHMSKEPESEEPIELIWDDIRISRNMAPRELTEVDRLRAKGSPNDLIIGTKDRVLAVIKPNGEIEFGDEYKPHEAALVFWQALARQRYQQEEQMLLNRHMEAVLSQLGAADMHLEAMRRGSQAGDPNSIEQIGRAQVRFEQLASAAIELGRGLCRRPDVPVPDIPQRIPDRIQQNPLTEYQGGEGIPSAGPDPEDGQA